MTVASFGLYTQEGEALADRLVRAICEDVAEDRLTRRQALDRAADAMERIAAIDQGMADPDAVEAIATRISETFAKAGFVTISGGDLRQHFERWSSAGPAVEHEPLPKEVAYVGEAVRAFSTAASVLFLRDDVTVELSPHDPVHSEFWEHEVAKAEIVVFAYAGEASGNPRVGCALNGPDGWAFVEHVTRGRNPAKLLASRVFKRDGTDYESLAAELDLIDKAIDNVNLFASLVNEPERLSFSLKRTDEGVHVAALWDGEPIGAARRDSEIAATLAQVSPVSDAAVPEALRFVPHEEGASAPTPPNA